MLLQKFEKHVPYEAMYLMLNVQNYIMLNYVKGFQPILSFFVFLDMPYKSVAN